MRTWLRRAPLKPDGAVLSWVNPEHPGYPYPEAAGFLLELLAQDGVRTAALRERIAVRLARDVSPRGGCGRDGVEYLFDTAVVLTGLLAHERAGGVLTVRLKDRLFGFLDSALRFRRATSAPISGDGHWSASYGCHQLRVLTCLEACRQGGLGDDCDGLASRLMEDLLPLFRGGRFRIHARSQRTYLHAHCYALEGLLGLTRRNGSNLRPVVRESAEWLAGVQRPCGGLPAWHDGRRAWGLCRTDATAQAVRLWSEVDGQAFARSITRGLAWLTRMQHRSGGLPYQSGSADLNTWATVFTVHAAKRGLLK